MFARRGFTSKSKIFDSFAFSVLCASTSTNHSPENPNVTSP